MSKFFKIDDELINLSQITDVKFKEERFTVSFTTPKKQFNKICENQKEFEDLRKLVSTHLEIIDLGEANNPPPPKNFKVNY
ncbi:hypothetical protein [Psychrobacter urativorans]|uniref:hypothetical protein n=1 Tax=Psychrobacter urativorans TaxID=45610 RepID=UPI00191993B4|nr:hypothetical protein [Psychrobacter urativorans]